MMGCILMANRKELELILGPMGQSIRESSKMDCVSAMESGSLEQKNMKDLISMIREMERGYIRGQVVAFIKGVLLRI